MTYGRKLELNVGGVQIKHESSADLRVSFDIQRDRSRDPNAALISIWNLAESTRDAFENLGRVLCTLDAGYLDDGAHNIFTGVLLDISSEKDAGGFRTDLTLGDDKEQRAANAHTHRTFPEGMPVSQVLRELVKACGLEGGNISEASSRARLAGSAELQRPWLASGQALNELQHFCRALGFNWTLQDQAVLFTGLSRGSFGRGPLFDASNLFQAPQYDAEGNIAVSSWLVPELMPGRPFQVDYGNTNAAFVASQTQHVGDTHGSDWYIAAVGEPFDQSISKGLIVDGKSQGKT